jgi:hypothetical protein
MKGPDWISRNQVINKRNAKNRFPLQGDEWILPDRLWAKAGRKLVWQGLSQGLLRFSTDLMD